MDIGQWTLDAFNSPVISTELGVGSRQPNLSSVRLSSDASRFPLISTSAEIAASFAIDERTASLTVSVAQPFCRMYCFRQILSISRPWQNQHLHLLQTCFVARLRLATTVTSLASVFPPTAASTGSGLGFIDQQNGPRGKKEKRDENDQGVKE